MSRLTVPYKGALCECGHSWWEHHWNDYYQVADSCMNCHCKLYSVLGSSCYWLVKLYYDLEYPRTHKAVPIIESWIGDEIRHEREQEEKRADAQIQRWYSRSPAHEAGK